MDSQSNHIHPNPYAGKKKPSMLRRSQFNDYKGRRMYMITLTVEGREPLLGTLKGNIASETDTPRVELSPLGKDVKEEWWGISYYYPQVQILSLQIMPDHLHGIIYLKEQMDKSLGDVIRGFKTGCNKIYRSYLEEKAVRYVATESQQHTSKHLETSEKNHLFSRGYNDKVLTHHNQLDHWFAYLKDNPRRLTIRRAYPDYFKVRFGLTIGSTSYAAIGNRFLLNYPEKIQVQLSRSLSEEDISVQVNYFISLAKQGAILVSPAISKGEQRVMRTALNAHLPLIFLTPWGFNSFSKPGHQYYEACAAGHLLLLAPWEHQNERQALTREMCLALNKMVEEVCGER